MSGMHEFLWGIAQEDADDAAAEHEWDGIERRLRARRATDLAGSELPGSGAETGESNTPNERQQ